MVPVPSSNISLEVTDSKGDVSKTKIAHDTVKFEGRHEVGLNSFMIAYSGGAVKIAKYSANAQSIPANYELKLMQGYQHQELIAGSQYTTGEIKGRLNIPTITLSPAFTLSRISSTENCTFDSSDSYKVFVEIIDLSNHIYAEKSYNIKVVIDSSGAAEVYSNLPAIYIEGSSNNIHIHKCP